MSQPTETGLYWMRRNGNPWCIARVTSVHPFQALQHLTYLPFIEEPWWISDPDEWIWGPRIEEPTL